MLETVQDIRRATKSDLGRLVPLWQEFMDYHRDLDPFFARAEDGHQQWVEFLEGKLDDDAWRLLVAEVGGELVGYGVATVIEYPPVLTTKHCGYVQDLAVTADCRGRGIGTVLYREIERWLIDRGVPRIELSVSVHNPRTGAFWRRLGFTDHVERLARIL